VAKEFQLRDHGDDHLYGPVSDEEVVYVAQYWDEDREVPADYVRKIGDQFEAVYNDDPAGRFATREEAIKQLRSIERLTWILPSRRPH